METDPVARALVSAAGVGLFPSAGEKLYGVTDALLTYRGYTRNMLVQSKMATLTWLSGVAALIGPRRVSGEGLADALQNTWVDIRKLIHGESAVKEIATNINPEDAYKSAFGDVDYDQLVHTFNEWNKNK